ncbi:MAG TPA: protein kinase [Vicinamibacterales bacterium]|nr:protein kinase [Vicinamibacterales bacterium]
MALGSGTRLGPYEIVDAIGAGGMGAVYRARDARLGRDVAIKALPDSSRVDPDRVARFMREAQTLAALNHPHIAAIYGLEEASPDGTHTAQYLILELVEGGTVADRLARGPLPVRDALLIARQVADALGAAHEKGVIHRDLKPANIALTKTGDAKVLDFGIAKAIAPDSDALTVAGAATEAGLVLGTAAYMSPEQARGFPVDRRSDIWAFGCVLFEMVTARRPFTGETVSDTMAAILGRDPDWSWLPADTPQRIVWLLRRCLQKDPRQRLHDIADARIEIDEALAHPREASLNRAPVAPRGVRPREWAAWTMAALAVAAAVRFAVTPRPPAAVETPAPYRAAIVLPGNLQLALQEGSAAASFALSPDGRRLAIVASEGDGKRMIWVRPLDGARAQPIAGTEDAWFPFWSPDSRSIGYFAQAAGGTFGIKRVLMRINIDGGQPVRLADAYLNTTATWNQDGVILFTPRGNAPIHRVSASGGPVSAVTTLDAATGDAQHAYPSFLPDGRHFLYSVIGSRSGATSTRGVYVGSLDGVEPPRFLLPGAMNARYANGYLAFMRGGSLFAQRFDTATLRLSGDPRTFADAVELSPGAGGGVGAAFSLSSNGVLVYQPAVDVRSQLTWFDRAGRSLGILGEPADYAEVDLAPDGRRAAVSVLNPEIGTHDLWVFDVARDTRDRFTDDPGDDIAPVWSPQGDRLAYSSERGGSIELFVKNAGGSGKETPLAVPGLIAGKFAAHWSPDGKYLLFVAGGRILARSDIWARPFDAKQTAFAIAETPYVETQPRVSPDGRWIAFVTSEAGFVDVYLTSFPAASDRQRVSAHGGMYPRWSVDGREIFFLTLPPDNTLMSAPVTYDQAGPHVGQSRPLFRAAQRPVVRLDGYPYDVSPDGRRFLVNILDQRPHEPLALVVNWVGTLAR